MSAPFVRVSEPAVVETPGVPGAFTSLKAGVKYRADDPLVVTYPWAFESDIEMASAAPGERRGAR